jgi:hypothetical protein
MTYKETCDFCMSSNSYEHQYLKYENMLLLQWVADLPSMISSSSLAYKVCKTHGLSSQVSYTWLAEMKFSAQQNTASRLFSIYTCLVREWIFPLQDSVSGIYS